MLYTVSVMVGWLGIDGVEREFIFDMKVVLCCGFVRDLFVLICRESLLMFLVDGSV